jgi:hypothetical protein
LNNPLRYTDPTGNRACGDGEEVDCNGHKQDPNQNPHQPKSPKPKKGNGRLPDYWTGQIGFSLPWISTATLGLVSGAGTLTYSNGHWYTAVGLNGGKTFVDLLLFTLPVSGNISGGWLFQPEKPSSNQMHNFLTGLAINVSAGVGIGGGVTWGNVGKFSKNDFAGEAGVYSPQVGVTATYTILDRDSKANTWNWLP